MKKSVMAISLALLGLLWWKSRQTAADIPPTSELVRTYLHLISQAPTFVHLDGIRRLGPGGFDEALANGQITRREYEIIYAAYRVRMLEIWKELGH